MRLVILSSLIVSSLIAVTGCGASGSVRHSSSSPSSMNVADTSSDPSWTPPGELNVNFAETAPAPERKSARHEAMTMQPNKRVPVKNALHAATY